MDIDRLTRVEREALRAAATRALVAASPAPRPQMKTCSMSGPLASSRPFALTRWSRQPQKSSTTSGFSEKIHDSVCRPSFMWVTCT